MVEPVTAEELRFKGKKQGTLPIFLDKDDVLSRESWFKEKEIKSYREFLREEEEKKNAVIRWATSTGRSLV